MIRLVGKFFLYILGWKIETDLPEYKKCVILGAPHTSNSDFFISMFYYFSRGIKISFFIKKEWFKFPFKGLMSALGGIPVDRGKKNYLIEQMKQEFESRNTLYLMIAPEGTRSKVRHWKRGFYYIAKAANVPIVLGYLDYKYKTIGVGDHFLPTEDVEADMLRTKRFYKTIHPKYPEKFTVGDV